MILQTFKVVSQVQFIILIANSSLLKKSSIWISHGLTVCTNVKEKQAGACFFIFLVTFVAKYELRKGNKCYLMKSFLFFDYVYKLMAYLLLFIAVRGGHGMP